MSKDFEFLPHTADIKMRAYGVTIQELFRNAMVGMFQSIGPQSSLCRTENDRLVCDQLPQHRSVKVKAREMDLLLIDFLSEALYLSDIHDEAYLDAKIHELTNTHIHATVHGTVIDSFETEIKAVTYHELELKKVDGIWQAIVVFDI